MNQAQTPNPSAAGTRLDRIEALLSQIAQEHRNLTQEHALTEKTVRQTNQQLGGLANKFGTYTEGLARTSLDGILHKMGMENVVFRAKVSRGNRNEEYDMLGWTNGKKNEVVLVEIKSNLDERELQQTLRKLKQFFSFMPEYKGKKLRGLIAAVELPEAMARRVAKLGLYLAQAADENFKLVPPPKGFKPAAF